jgi:CRISPR type III-A-associated RAMP protein Csm4
MPAALIVRFRPVGPWRFGPANGAREQVDRIFHSDSLFSAVTIAMRDLGWLDEWLDATARAQSPSVRLSSCFPYIRRSLLIQPPRSVWPPAQTGKLRWKAARFVPVSLIPSLLRGEELKEEQWAIEPVSGCVLPIDRNNGAVAPFRLTRRVAAPVDRVAGASEHGYTTACIQFAASAGMWFLVTFEDHTAQDVWQPRIRAAARLLADSGIGGERSRGWGRSAPPNFEDADFPSFLIGGEQGNGGGERAWWLLSLFTPAQTDSVDWSRGNYEVLERTGRVDSRLRSGDLKPASRMVAEGSVLLSAVAPAGAVQDVAPPEAAHPVYRSGSALAVPMAWHESRRLSWLAGERPQAAPVVVVEPAKEEPPKAEEPTAEEPVTQAAVMQEDVTAEEAAASEDLSSSEEPPVEEPPVQEPPVEEPPADEPPLEEPPIEEPPAEEPPIQEPVTQDAIVEEVAAAEQEASSEGLSASEEPPVQEPPVEEPPADEPPLEEPPIEAPPPGALPVEEPVTPDAVREEVAAEVEAAETAAEDVAATEDLPVFESPFKQPQTEEPEAPPADEEKES